MSTLTAIRITPDTHTKIQAKTAPIEPPPDSSGGVLLCKEE